MDIRFMREEDASILQVIYRNAFSGPPWNERLSEETVSAIWMNQSQRPGFECLVACLDQCVVAATWYDRPTLELLAGERGQQLAEYAESIKQPDTPIIWIRETICDPEFSGKGVAGALKREAYRNLQNNESGALLLTRMRDDNVAIVHLNRTLGFQKTGIRVPSHTFPGLMHDYWFMQL